MKEEIKAYFDSIILAQKLENSKKFFIISNELKPGIDNYFITFERSGTKVTVEVTKKNIKTTIEFSTIRMRDEYYFNFMSALFTKQNYTETKPYSPRRTRELREKFIEVKHFKDFFSNYVVDYWG